MKTKRGITLIELLIAVALSGILLTILVKILIPGLQIWRQTQAVSEIEQNAMIAVSQIETELLNTTADSITVVDRLDRQAISCLNNEGTLTQPGYDGNTADVFWRSMTIFDLNPSEGKLRHFKHELPSIVTDPFAFSEAEIDSTLAGRTGRLVASKVTSLQLLPPPADQKLWQLQMTLENDTPRGVHVIRRELNMVPRIQNL